MVRRMTCHVISVMFATLLAPSLAAASGVHALFDLDAGTTTLSPFPSDRFTVRDTSQNTGLRVDLPKPTDCSIQVSDCKDVDTLNTLDGFNLQPRLSIPFSGPIDISTVTSDTVFLVNPEGRRIGINEVVWDVESNNLHVESDELLEQHSQYVLIVTRGVRDLANEPLEASGEFQAFQHGKKIGHDGAVPPYRQALIAGLERAGAAGVDQNRIAVASVFTTQSITAILEKIRDQIKAITPEPASFVLGPGGERTVAPVGAISGITFRRQLRTNPNFVSANELTRQLASVQQNPDFPVAVGHVAFGKYRSPSYLTPCIGPTREAACDRFMPPVGTGTGTPLVQSMEEIFFNLFLPAETPLGETPERRRPAAGWPVVILGMGSSDNKELGSYLAAPAMAAHGIALIAINGLGQGFGPLSTLTLRADLNGDGIVDSATFSSGPRSFDQNGDGLIGTGTVPPANEGNEVLPQGSSISRRDVLRQTVVDLMQLVRVIEVGIDVDGDGSADLDPSRIYFVGFSQGASIGTMFAAIEPQGRAVVLNVVGGANIEAFRLSPSTGLAWAVISSGACLPYSMPPESQRSTTCP